MNSLLLRIAHNTSSTPFVLSAALSTCASARFFSAGVGRRDNAVRYSSSMISAAGVIPGKVLAVVPVEVGRLGGKLVDAAGHDRADHALHVKLGTDEVLRQRVEQFWVTRRVRVAKVIDLVVKPAAEEMAPHAVD